jgi:hypothetical protein
VAVTGAAHAATIPGLFTTGVDSSGNALSLGVADPHYVVVETDNNAFTLSSIPGSYIPNNATSLWIWQQANGQPTNVTRTFRTTFSLTGLNPSTASIMGTWAADNFLDQILINGVSIGTIPNNLGGFNFGSFSPFNINSGFQADINTLDFVVRDVGVISGFRVGEISGTAQPISQSVPEPSSTLGILALGVLAAGSDFKRKLSPTKESNQADG